MSSPQNPCPAATRTTFFTRFPRRDAAVAQMGRGVVRDYATSRAVRGLISLACSPGTRLRPQTRAPLHNARPAGARNQSALHRLLSTALDQACRLSSPFRLRDRERPELPTLPPSLPFAPLAS